jgi:hypothetical protein
MSAFVSRGAAIERVTVDEVFSGTWNQGEARLRFGACTVSVESNCQTILHGIRTLYAPAVVSARDSISPSDVCLEVVERWSDGESSYVLEQPDADPLEFSAASDALSYLEYLVGKAAVRGLAGHLLVHAGVVSTPAGGIVLPGVSGAGKSTLVTALSLAGYAYLSDEIAVVDLQQRFLLPFSKAICLKEGGWQALTETYQMPSPLYRSVRLDGKAVYYVPAATPCPPDQRPSVRFVLLPRRRAGVRPTLERVTRAHALMELSGQSLNLARHGQEGVECLARIVEGAECYALTYDALPPAVATISALAGGEPAALHRSSNPSVSPIPAG